MSEEEQRNWLRNEILDVKKQMFKNANRYHLPEQISLLDGFTLLHVLGYLIERCLSANLLLTEETADRQKIRLM